VADGHVPFQVQLVSDDLSGLEEIAEGLATSDWDAARISQTRRRSVVVPGNGLTAQQVVQVAAARLASVARVTVDAGAHMLPVTWLWPVADPNGMLISNGLATMGFALPAAVGAALADRTRPVVALTGDGGLLMCAGELLTAAREKLRIITIVFADASLSLIDIKQRARGLTSRGVALGATDWSQVARGFGAAAFRADDEPSLARAVDQALECDGPCVVDARIDPSNYGRTLAAVRGGHA
jgi:acetolactate synthase-1/2/3 large subunit